MSKKQNTPGHAFRAAFLDAYESDAIVDLTLLDQAASMLDEIAALARILEQDGVLTEGSKGQPVAHPALAQLRAHRAAFQKMCRDFEPNSGSARKAGAQLANQRWRG